MNPTPPIHNSKTPPRYSLTRIILNTLWAERVAIFIILLLLTLYWFFKHDYSPQLPRRGPDLTKLSYINRVLDTFTLDNGRYPTTTEGLDALVHRPQGLTATWRKLLDEVPRDKWGSPFHYSLPSASHPDRFDLHSLGPDKIDGTADDVYSDRDFVK